MLDGLTRRVREWLPKITAPENIPAKEPSAAVGEMFRGFTGYIQADAKKWEAIITEVNAAPD